MAGASVSRLTAQELNDEMKKKFRQSLITPEQKQLHYQPHKPVEAITQRDKGVLRVSPTTKLPSKLDRIAVIEPLSPEPQIHINLNVTNQSYSQLERSAVDYSTGKYNAVPDARSITQWVQHTRADYGLGFYISEGAADWLYVLRGLTTPPYSGFDIDPVRAIQRYKARKRKEKVDMIKKIYPHD